MKLEYLHKSGGTALSAPSGATYDFTEDEAGRRVAVVADRGDAEWFLSQRNGLGELLFQALNPPTKPAKPAPRAVDPDA